jgi:hypothetical protein
VQYSATPEETLDAGDQVMVIARVGGAGRLSGSTGGRTSATCVHLQGGRRHPLSRVQGSGRSSHSRGSGGVRGVLEPRPRALDLRRFRPAISAT